jgi:hypothetical protein
MVRAVMKRYTSILFILLIILSYNSYIYGQSTDDVFPQFFIGGGVGHFGSSVNNFDQVYGTKGGFTYGGEGSIQLMEQSEDKRIYGVVQYYIFEKSGTTVGDYEVDIDWSETITDIGIRYCWRTDETFSWLGGGLSQPRVIEKFQLNGENIEFDKTASGFYVEYGARFEGSVFTNIKYSSGEVGGEGGVGGETVDIGGISFIIGFTL